jgi:hypothetical protein
MKFLSTYLIVTIVLFSFLTTAVAQTSSAATPTSTNRVAFTLKNSLGYHRMFRVEGPGIAYGFTMNRRETVPCNWPVGAKLYFSSDGEIINDHILTVTADDAGKTLTTGSRESASKVTESQKPVSTPETSVEREVTVRFRNNSIKFQKVALITYEPGEPGNSTNIFTLAPYAFTSRKFAVGTRVYFANDKQVGVVMSGQPLTDKPFLVVRKEDSGKLFNIFE